MFKNNEFCLYRYDGHGILRIKYLILSENTTKNVNKFFNHDFKMTVESRLSKKNFWDASFKIRTIVNQKTNFSHPISK